MESKNDQIHKAMLIFQKNVIIDKKYTIGKVYQQVEKKLFDIFDT